MNTVNQNTQEKKTLNLVKKSESFKLLITKEIEEKIRHICKQIWEVEWSGILFYKPEGTIEDKNLVIRCEDIFVMDIGSSSYTEFEMSPDVIHYMTENPELIECQMGLIHSHNLMPSFFSGTDFNTLKEEGMDRNHFVSLIVNNRGVYTAAITRRVKVTEKITETATYKSFNDVEKSSTDIIDSENERLEYFNLAIIFEGSNTIDDALLSRLSTIKENKAKVQSFPAKYGGYTPSFSLENKEIKGSRNSEYPHFESDEDTLFDTENYSAISNRPNSISNSTSVSYDRNRANSAIIKSLLLQLITGSVIISNENKIDASKWAKGMVPLFEKRFGRGEKGMEIFSDWADCYIEFLTWNTKDANLFKKGFTREEIQAIYAYDLMEELNKLPQNVYIRKFINLLDKYVYEF